MVTLFDARALREIQAQELKRKREALDWLMSVIHNVDAGVDLGKLGHLPGTSLVSQPSVAALQEEGVHLTLRQAANIQESNGTSLVNASYLALQDEGGNHIVAAVSKVPEGGNHTVFDPKQGKQVVAKPGTVEVKLHLARLRKGSEHLEKLFPSSTLTRDGWLDILMWGVLAELHTRLNMELAKEAMPNADKEYFTITRERCPYPAFYWKFGNGWSIRVGTDDALFLLKQTDSDEKL